MEVFFCARPQFFAQCIHTGRRKGQQTQQSFHQRGQTVAQRQKPGAENLEVQHRPAEHRRHHIKPHHTPLGKEGVEEKGGGYQKPEE